MQSPTLLALLDSLIRVTLTIVVFYVIQSFYPVENTLVLALVSVVIAHVISRLGIRLIRKKAPQDKNE